MIRWIRHRLKHLHLIQRFLFYWRYVWTFSKIGLLNCIYADVFTVKDNSSMSYFDIEHIATKDWMKTLMRDTKISNVLAVSHIANAHDY